MSAEAAKPRIHERAIVLVNATASEQYHCVRRITEALVFSTTLVFIAVCEVNRYTLKEKAQEVAAVEIVKWFWLLAANAYLWFILLAEHLIRELLPLQPLAMSIVIAGYFFYAVLVSVDLHFYWGLGTVAQAWIVLTAIGVVIMMGIVCRLRQLENGDETGCGCGLSFGSAEGNDVEDGEGQYLLAAGATG